MGFDMVSQVAHETAKLCAFSTDEGAVKDTFAQGQVDVFFHQSDKATCGVVACMCRGDDHSRMAVAQCNNLGIARFARFDIGD